MLHSQECQRKIPENVNFRQERRCLPCVFCAVAVAFCRFLSVFVDWCRLLSICVGLCRYANDSSPAQPILSFGSPFRRFVSDFVAFCRFVSQFVELCRSVIAFHTKRIWRGCRERRKKLRRARFALAAMRHNAVCVNAALPPPLRLRLGPRPLRLSRRRQSFGRRCFASSMPRCCRATLSPRPCRLHS